MIFGISHPFSVIPFKNRIHRFLKFNYLNIAISYHCWKMFVENMSHTQKYVPL